VERVQASFDHCNFSYADLAEVTLPGCHLTHCNFTGANLKAADLTGAHLIASNLEGADLDEARLAGADIRGCSVSDLNLLDLETHVGLKINLFQQESLFATMGVRVFPDPPFE
jgi:uncharacterized protein YjbI with pentapeptide repeats